MKSEDGFKFSLKDVSLAFGFFLIKTSGYRETYKKEAILLQKQHQGPLNAISALREDAIEWNCVFIHYVLKESNDCQLVMSNVKDSYLKFRIF